MTSEYAQFRQWQAVCDAMKNLSHRCDLEPVVVTEKNPDVRVSLLICDHEHAFIFSCLGAERDWRIEMRVCLADCDERYELLSPYVLRNRLDAAASAVALEILEHVE